MGNHAEHLRQYQWQRGQGSPNPGGRPKRRPLTSGYQKFLATELPVEMRRAKDGRVLFPDGTTWLDVVIRALVQKAASGDIRAVKELREAIEGRAGQRLEFFREELPEEPPNELQRAVMELDPVDRNLIVAATSKVLAMINDESMSGAEALDAAEALESAPATGTENVTGDAGAGSTSEPDKSPDQTG